MCVRGMTEGHKKKYFGDRVCKLNVIFLEDEWIMRECKNVNEEWRGRKTEFESVLIWWDWVNIKRFFRRWVL